MLYVYKINIIIYLDTRLVLDFILVRFRFSRYRNIGIIRVFKSLWFGYGSDILVRLFCSVFFLPGLMETNVS